MSAIFIVFFFLLIYNHAKPQRDYFMKSIVKKKYSEHNIISDITDFISEKHLKKDTKLMSSAKMAERYNVSPITVNRAVDKLVQKGILYRIQGSGTYVAKQEYTDQKLRAGVYLFKQNSKGPIIQAAFGQIGELLLSSLKSMGLKVDFIPKPPPYDLNTNNEHVGKYDVLIIAAGMLSWKNSKIFESLGIPVISMLSDKVLSYPVHQVFYNYEPGFKKAVEYMKSKGYSKVYIAATYGDTSTNRRSALVKCLNSEGIEYIDLPLVKYDSSEASMLILNAREAGKYFIDNKLDGIIFSLSDFISFGIMDVIKERGLKLGKDIKLISYDNLERFGVCPYGEPVLTGVTLPITRLVDEVSKLADDILRNNIKSNEITKLISVNADEFIIRKSA